MMWWNIHTQWTESLSALMTVLPFLFLILYYTWFYQQWNLDCEILTRVVMRNRSLLITASSRAAQTQRVCVKTLWSISDQIHQTVTWSHASVQSRLVQSSSRYSTFTFCFQFLRFFFFFNFLFFFFFLSTVFSDFCHQASEWIEPNVWNKCCSTADKRKKNVLL